MFLHATESGDIVFWLAGSTTPAKFEQLSTPIWFKSTVLGYNSSDGLLLRLSARQSQLYGRLSPVTLFYNLRVRRSLRNLQVAILAEEQHSLIHSSDCISVYSPRYIEIGQWKRYNHYPKFYRLKFLSMTQITPSKITPSSPGKLASKSEWKRKNSSAAELC